MITSLRLKNFKLFKDQTFEFKNLNLLTGLNGMGKSTAIQALLLLREAKFADILYKSLRLSGNELFNVGQIKDLRYEFAEKPFTIDIDLGINNQINSFVYDAENSKKTNIHSNSINLETKNITTENITEHNLFSEDNFVYLQADRIIPADSYPTGRGLKNKFGNRGEYSLNFYHANQTNFLVDKNLCLSEVRTLAAQVQAWLSYVSPEIKVHTQIVNNSIHLDYSFHNSNKHFTPSNVGFGITYCLPIIISLLSAQAGDLLIIENPESHLHPKGQSKLAELMCLAAQNGVQIFCETHSDHIIDGTLVSVYEHYKDKTKGISHENVNISFFRRKENESVSEVVPVEISETGRFKQPKQKDFFDQIGIDVSRLSKR